MELTPFAVIDTDCIDRFKYNTIQYNTIQYCPTSYNLLYVCPVLYQTTKCLKAKLNI